MNTILPGGLGAGEYHPRMHVEDHKWFCSQLVGCALQAMSDDDALAAAPPPSMARNALRALAELLVVLASVAAGLLAGLGMKAGGTGASLAALGGLAAGLVALVALGALVAMVFVLASPRQRLYSRRGVPADWRGVICRETHMHKSSPNSLYDLLHGVRGVYPSRDPYSNKMLGV